MRKAFKKLGLSFATLVCAVCAGVGVSLGYSKGVTKAVVAENATTATISGANYYVSGAGIRLVNDANGAGLRFHTRLADAEYAKLTGAYKTGTLIIPEIRYDGDLTLEDMDKELKYRPVQIETTDIWYDSSADGFMQSTAYLYDIPQKAYGARYVARSYIQYADGKVAYSAVGSSSLTDIAKKMPETDERKPTVQPYIVESVEITVVMPDGNVKYTVPYGKTLDTVSLEYDAELYALTSVCDQYGRQIENLADYEVTLPVTITPTFEAKAAKNAVLTQFLKDCYAATAANRGFQNGSTATAVNDAAPEGFESALRLDWYKESTEIWRVNGTPLWRGCFDDTLDLSNYDTIRFAMKMETSGDAKFVGNNCSGAEADKVVFENGKWVTIQLKQTSANVWDMTVTGEDGNVLYAVKGVSRTDGDKDTLQNLVFGSIYANGGYTHVLQFYAPTSADYDISIYQTEVLAERTAHLPSIEADTIIAHVWNPSCFEGGSSTAKGKWSNEAAPTGFEKVTEYAFSGDLPTWELINTDLSAYSDVYFAMKAKSIYLQNCAVGAYVGGGWLYVHIHQNDDGTWNKDFTSADLTCISIGEQVNIAGTGLYSLVEYSEAKKSGSYPNGGDGTPAYFTEIKGILKEGSSGNTGNVQIDDPTDIPANAEVIRNYLWRDDKYALTPNSQVTEAVPEGYSLIQEFKWGPHGIWSQTEQSFNTFCVDTTADISSYTDIYWAIKATNVSYIEISNSSNGNYQGSDWLYLHFSKQSDGTWKYSVKSLNGFTANSNSPVSATTLQTLAYCILPYRADVSMQASVYFTEPRGVCALDKEVWGERVIFSAVEKWSLSDKELALPEGFTSLYKKDNFSKGDFALLNLSDSAYKEIRFAIMGISDMGVNSAYGISGSTVTVIAGNIYDWKQMHLITLTKNDDDTWKLVFEGRMYADDGNGTRDVVHVAESIAGSNLQEVMDNFLGTYMPSTTVYVTEVRGVHTCNFEYVSLGNGYLQLICNCGKISGEPIPFAQDIIPEDATKVRDSIWRSDGYGLSSSTDMEAPYGFTMVSEFNWNGNIHGYMKNDLDFQAFIFDNPTFAPSLDITQYSDLYFALKLVNGKAYYVQTVGWIAVSDWLYVHYSQATDGTWNLSLRSADGTVNQENIVTGIVGSDFQTIMSYSNTYTHNGFYPTRESAEQATFFYMTDVRAISVCNHTEVSYVPNGDGTHKTVCVCGEVIETATACTGVKICGATGTCNVCQGEYVNSATHNAVWDGSTYQCERCQEVFGTVTENVTEIQEIALYTNATYADKAASGNAFDASVARSVAIDLSEVTELEISEIANVAFNGVAYTVSGLEANQVTIDGVVPYDVFGEYTLTAQITVKGATFAIQMPILVVTDLITTADGLLNVRKVLRGQDATIAHDTANPVDYLVIGGMGGLGTMNGRGYYKLGADIDLANHSIASVNASTANSYNRVYVFGTTAVPFAGTFDGAGYVLHNFIAKPNFWNYNVASGFTYLFQDPKGVTGDSHAQEIEASLFGMVDGTIKNLAITNAVFGQNGNVVNGGGGTLENVYVQINDLQADAHVFVAPIAQHLGENNMTLTNVVVDLTKHSSAILNGTSATAISTHYPSIFGLGAAHIENVGVYGFNTAWIDTTAGRGNVYAGNTDGSAIGIYTAGLTMTNGNANFWQVGLDPTIWKIVGGVPMLVNVSANGTVTEQDRWTGEVGGDYNIAWNDEAAGSYEAVTKIRGVTEQVTANVLGVTAEEDANILVGTYDRYAEAAGVDVSTLSTDGRENYGVYNNGNKIYVLADGETGFGLAADMLLRQLYGYNELAEDSFAWTDSTLSLERVENKTAQVVFSEREAANGYNSGDMNFNATKTYTTYGHMHNALDYLYATDGNGNITGGEIVSVTGKNDANQDVTYTTTSYWLSSNCDDVSDGDNIDGEQLCYLAHGDKTAFNALVDHVANRILEIAKAKPNMTAINFMIEDDSEYCMCATCKPFYNASIPQLLFLNTVAEKLASNEYLKNSCRTIDIVFLAYASYMYAPITSTEVATSALANAKSALGLSDTATETVSFTYADRNKAGATYAAAKDTTSRSVLKAHKNLRLQWTSHHAFHSYALIHEANSESYLGLMAWLASVDAFKTEVFMYQTTFSDYFLPLNTWKYQVEWYKSLNDMGINGYIFNLGDLGNPVDTQTGFAAFKAYIDSRAMTDSSVTYEQLKNEFFGVNGYYGTAGPTMRTLFEELESVMDGKRQTGNYVDCGNFSHSDYDATNYPYYHYYTDGTSKQAVRTTHADRVQAWFNGAFDLSQTWILFGDLADGALDVATSVGTNENPSPIHAALTLSPQTNVYTYGEKTQLETLKAWYQYCVTAKGIVAADSIYAKRIQVESWFPEYALRLFHSTYTVNFNLVKGDYSLSGFTYNYSATCTGVTSTLSADTGLSRSAAEFYNELIAGGMIRPSEQFTFNTAEKLSIGWIQTFYRNDGKTSFRSANCVCEISASPFVNWGVF